MFKHEQQIRVRYGETDRMGYVYYGNYSLYYEQCRTDAIRNLGLTYKEMEDSGIIMPVTRMNVKFILPAKYDELLTIVTVIPEMPGKQIKFVHEIYNEEQDLINKAEIQLLFIHKKSNKLSGIPELLQDQLQKFFNET